MTTPEIPDTDWDEFAAWCDTQAELDDEVDDHERMNNYARGF